MNFHRTPSGLANLHLFYGVDAIIFVEGGDPSRSLAGIVRGEYDGISLDIRFWSIVFGTYAPLRRFQFRAVGSKPNLLALADYISANSISNVIVCADRDTDDITGALRTNRAVLYTRGYSWENDVWTPSLVTALFYDLCAVAKDSVDIQSIVDVAFRRFSRSIEPTIRIEILLLQNAFDGLDRSAIRGCLRIDRHDAPCIDRSRIRHVIRQRRTTVHARIRRVSDRKPEALCDCQGHLLADFAFHLLAHLLRKYCKAKTIPKDLVSTAALTRFERQVAVDPQVHGYYQPLVAALRY